VAPCVAGGAIDRKVFLRGFTRRPVIHQRTDPAVRHAGGQSQCARLVRADPDLDRVRRHGAGVDSLELVVATVEADPAPPLHIACMTATASSSAAMLSPGVRAGAPIARCRVEVAARADAELEPNSSE
jgi:hypothetical protein